MLRALWLICVLLCVPQFARAEEGLPPPIAQTETVAFPVRVDRIIVQGLTRTREAVVLRDTEGTLSLEVAALP